MHTVRDRGVLPDEHGGEGSRLAPLDWETVRIFLRVVRCGSFRSASEEFGLSFNTLRGRIDRLEEKLGYAVLTRHVDGVKITPEGEHVLAAAERMELAAFDLLRLREFDPAAISGAVRLATTDGLGTYWLAPRLAHLRHKHPELLIDMHCAMRPADVLRLEADIAVQITRPAEPDLKIFRLGKLHAIPFASQSYLDERGTPQSLSDLARHRLVLQVAAQVDSQEAFERYFPGVPELGVVTVRTNSSAAHLAVLENGGGIGMVPTYLYAVGAKVVPLPIDLRVHYDIWASYHPDVARSARVRYVLDWLSAAFAPARYPWFREEFLYPEDSWRGRINGHCRGGGTKIRQAWPTRTDEA